MPTYQVPARTVLFSFEDGDLKGLEAVFRLNISLDAYFDLLTLAGVAGDRKAGLEAVRNLIRQVAEIGLVSWNLTDGGKPVPATAEAFTAHLPSASAARLVNRYLSEIGALSGPLVSPSANGAPSAKRRASKSQPK